MTDRLFANCCYGSEHQHMPDEPCPRTKEPGYPIEQYSGEMRHCPDCNVTTTLVECHMCFGPTLRARARGQSA